MGNRVQIDPEPSHYVEYVKRTQYYFQSMTPYETIQWFLRSSVIKLSVQEGEKKNIV